MDLSLNITHISKEWSHEHNSLDAHLGIWQVDKTNPAMDLTRGHCRHDNKMSKSQTVQIILHRNCAFQHCSVHDGGDESQDTGDNKCNGESSE